MLAEPAGASNPAWSKGLNLYIEAEIGRFDRGSQTDQHGGQ